MKWLVGCLPAFRDGVGQNPQPVARDIENLEVGEKANGVWERNQVVGSETEFFQVFEPTNSIGNLLRIQGTTLMKARNREFARELQHV
jgi:hypothetical protein